ncbi:hypothetical protein CEXT_125591 [Caerostris extrusa]|uniref:Uncharacterized protein n=1 Tax=Caerostris extrusa TaxID=172846 RepID=A0AAV4QZ52_CAEEX|nr:hypothetical protein CEXT_125591 [Caerostris extrusa]
MKYKTVNTFGNFCQIPRLHCKGPGAYERGKECRKYRSQPFCLATVNFPLLDYQKQDRLLPPSTLNKHKLTEYWSFSGKRTRTRHLPTIPHTAHPRLQVGPNGSPSAI